MCGIAGALAAPGAEPVSLQDLRGMTDCIAHRGPDDEGHLVEDGGIGLGHRRLSIVDLSPLGHQPMSSASGRWAIAFNGEIYNFRELAAELQAQGAHFRGQSDTEVILAAVEAWGLDAAVSRFVGIFAFALWDRRDRTLQLVRDHLGVKPLYYAETASGFLFASELRPLARRPEVDRRIDRGALTLLLRHNCIPAPYSIYRGVRKLAPGSILTVNGRDGQSSVRSYWSARDVAERGQAHPFQFDDAAAVDALDALMRDAVGLQMVADVPLGAFLSGGVDSSAVVALMQAQSARPVRTFSIGFEDPAFDEVDHARSVAAHLGTDHTEMRVTSRDALDVVPELPRLFDEPFADSSQIPTYLVSRMAREQVTVALSGDGGDELFAGYNRHVHGEQLWGRMRHVPTVVRRVAARAVLGVSPAALTRTARVLGIGGGRHVAAGRVGDQLHKLAGVVGAGGPDEMYLRLTSHWSDPASAVVGGVEPPTLLSRDASRPHLGGMTEQMQYLDLVTYLPDDILTKVDRASMAVGLEARVPLLDHRLVEFAWHLPRHMKLRDGRGKWLLRQVLNRYVPETLIDRPKTGFGVPLAAWLRGPLRDWAESLLDEGRLREEGFFEPSRIRRAWATHLSGRADLSYALWDVLMFQAWLQQAPHDAG